MDASGTFLAKRAAKGMDRQGAQGSSDPQCDLGVSLMCNQVLSSPDHRSPLRDSLLQQAKLDEANQARGAAHPSCPWTDLVDASSVCHPVPLCSAGSRRPRGSWYLVLVAPELALHRAMRPCANWPGRPCVPSTRDLLLSHNVTNRRRTCWMDDGCPSWVPCPVTLGTPVILSGAANGRPQRGVHPALGALPYVPRRTVSPPRSSIVSMWPPPPLV